MNNRIVSSIPKNQITSYSFKILLIYFLPLFSLGQQAIKTNTHQPLNGIEDTVTVLSILKKGDAFKTNNPDSAYHYYEMAGDLARRLNWNDGISQYIRHVIFIFNNQGKYHEALKLCEEALQLAKRSNDKKQQAIAYNNVANEYQYLGELALTADNYLKAAQLAESMHELSILKVFDNNLSSVFFSLKQYDKSFSYAKQSFQIAQQLKDTSGMAYSLVNLGVSEIHLNHPSEALQHFQEVLHLNETINDYTLSCDSYTNIASIEMDSNHIDQAKKNYEQVRQLADQNANPNYQVLALAGLADVYSKEKEWAKAKPLVEKAIQIAAATGDRNSLVQLYEKAASVSEGLHDLRGELGYRHQYEKLNDSLLNENTRTHINELETRYQAAKKDQQLSEQQVALLQSEKLVHTKNTQLFGLVAGLLLLVLFVLLGKRLLHQRQKVAVLNAELKGQEQERKRIAQEMHDDMGSGLTTLLYLGQSLTEDNGTERAAAAKKMVTITTSLVETMNEIVWSMNQRYNSLEDLVSYIRQQSTSWMERPGIHYQLDIPDEIPDISLSGEKRRNIYLIIKEALHNVLKHSGATQVTLQMNFNKEIFVAIIDNGSGFTIERSQKGNGLANIQERINALKGSMNIFSKHGTIIELHIPL
jgi:Signal transduction histidine kinase